MNIAPNKRPLWSLYTANAISLAGNNLSTIAIPWFVISTTGSAAKTGITGFFAILPIIIASVLGGAVVDRLGYKRSSVISDIASGLSVAAIAILHVAGLLSFPILMVLVFLGAFLDAPGSTARAAMIPELAESAGDSIEKSTSTVQVIERGSRLVSAPLAGILIAAFGPVTVLWLNAASFAISCLIVQIGIPANLHPAAQNDSSEGYFASLRAGFAFIRRDALITSLLVTVAITNALDVARSLVGFPVLAREVYDSSVALGILFAASGGGSVIGAILYARYGHRYKRRSLFIFSFIMVGIPTLIYAALPPLWVVILGQFLMGLSAGPLNPIIMTVEFARVPPEMRGRVFGAITAGAFIAMPIGVLAGGYLIDAVGLGATFLIIGLIYVPTTASMILLPAIHEMDTLPSNP